MLLVLTFLLATNQAKALILNGTLGFQINLAREKETGSNKLNKFKMKNSIINEPGKDNDQTLTSGTNGEKYTRVKEDMSISRFSTPSQ